MHQQSRGMFTPVRQKVEVVRLIRAERHLYPCAQRTHKARGLPVLEVRKGCDAMQRTAICCSQQNTGRKKKANGKVHTCSVTFFLTEVFSHWKSTPISNYALTRSHTQQRGTNSPESRNSAGTHFPLYELEQSQAINAHQSYIKYKSNNYMPRSSIKACRLTDSLGHRYLFSKTCLSLQGFHFFFLQMRKCTSFSCLHLSRGQPISATYFGTAC